MNREKKKIGIIIRSLSSGGVGRLIYKILDELNKIKKMGFEITLIYMDENETLINNKKLKNSFKNIKKLYKPGKNKFIWDYIQLPFYLKYERFDVLIYLKNHIPITNVLIPSKKINIVHDLLDLESTVDSNKFVNSIYNKLFFKLSCRLADKVLAISESTKREIINKLNIPPSKINVIELAVDDKFYTLPSNSPILEKTKKGLNLPDKFILYIGSDVPRKNLEHLASAFKGIMNNVPHSLILVGKSVKGLHKKLAKKEKIQWKGYVSEEELIALYNLADLFVFPSLYEGFGLPILEAQACGTPVLTSNVTSCPEVAGNSAHLVDPYSIDDIKNGMLKIIKNKDYKEKLIKSGFENIKRFSWEKTVKKMMKEINMYDSKENK